MPKNLSLINSKTRYTISGIGNRFGLDRELLWDWIDNKTLKTQRKREKHGQRWIIFGKDLIDAIKRNRPDWWTK